MPQLGVGTRVSDAELRLQGEIVRRAQAGDPDALTQLHAEHAERVYRYFLARLDGRAEPAEDLAAEVFLRMLQRLGRYECRGLPFSAWLFRIAHNILVDHFRREPRDSLLCLDAARDAPSPRGELELHRVDDTCDLARALGALTGSQRDVLELRFVAGLSFAEAAAVVGKTEDAAKKLQARGLTKLRSLLLQPGAASTASGSGA
jgi:RNA polymerase sigma-70 factor, ECF subfamily